MEFRVGGVIDGALIVVNLEMLPNQRLLLERMIPMNSLVVITPASADASPAALLQVAQNPATDANTLLGIARNNATDIAGLTAIVRHPNVNATILDVVAEHQNASRALIAEILARRANLGAAVGAILLAGKQSPS